MADKLSEQNLSVVSTREYATKIDNHSIKISPPSIYPIQEQLNITNSMLS